MVLPLAIDELTALYWHQPSWMNRAQVVAAMDVQEMLMGEMVTASFCVFSETPSHNQTTKKLSRQYLLGDNVSGEGLQTPAEVAPSAVHCVAWNLPLDR
jgi:hypothetical protein